VNLKNTEKFIKKWEKVRQKGKFKFILIDCIIFSAISWAGFITMYIIDKGKFSPIYIFTEYYYYIFAVVILGIIRSRLDWSKNEEKYNALLNNK
jgi:hypothetical protein